MRWSCLYLLALVFLCGCAVQPHGVPVAKDAHLAVAGFVHPQYNWEFLAGYAQQAECPGLKDALPRLDQELASLVRKRFEGRVLGPALTNQCREIVLAEGERQAQSALKFWVQVGKCLPADYLLVPQVFTWQERQGGDWGVERPAQVILEFYLIDVEQGLVAGRFRYDQQQRSLSEDVLSMPLFFKRGGKWVTAMDLAREGMQQGLEALGL
jgi:hypothetical protein